ncbi:Mbov_0121 family peptidase domain-containing ABC transporter [Mycoplasmopsis arginini]|uniref:Mbov_0121 family peptidase domain-containing ABC transporter n=1 Tax=Mycoplasmopsis arginini TaxID=2094 RepID=UPI0035177803
MQIKIQDDIKDCGLYVLQSLHKLFWRKWIDVNQLKYRAIYSENGISISNLTSLAKDINLELEAYKINWEEFLNLKSKTPVISIIKIDNFLHYIIIKKIKNGLVEILDSVNGKRRIELQNFQKLFSGLILIVNKSSTKNKIEMYFKNSFLKPEISFKLLFATVYLSVLLVLFNYFLSFVSKYIFSYIQEQNKVFALKNILLFVWVSFLSILVSFIITLIQNLIKNKISKAIKLNYVDKVKKSSYNQINKISKNEIILRYLAIDSIAYYYSSITTFLPTIIMSLFLFFPLLLFVQVKFLILIIFLNILKIIIGFFINFKIYNLSKQNTIKTVEEINELSFLINRDNSYYNLIWNNVDKFNYLENIQTIQINDNKLNKLNSLKNLFFGFLNLISNLIIYIVFVINNSNNISELLFILQIQTIINNPANDFQNFLIANKIFKINYHRIAFILDIPTLSNLSLFNKNKNPINTIYLNNLSFQYDKKLIINNLNLTINKGLIITGQNGSGKSTLIKIISGLIKDYQGSVVFNNTDISEFSQNWFDSHVFFSDKEKDLPNLDLYTYIFWNINENERDKILNNKDFQFILKILNLDIFSNILINKNKLSLGQLQLIKLLPLLIKKYQIILLDECFDSLSKKTFKIVKKIIREKQKNSLIIETSHNNRFLNEKAQFFNIKK